MEIDFPQINNDFTVFSKLFHVFYNKVEIINVISQIISGSFSRRGDNQCRHWRDGQSA
jgi:hypothetical protein